MIPLGQLSVFPGKAIVRIFWQDIIRVGDNQPGYSADAQALVVPDYLIALGQLVRLGQLHHPFPVKINVPKPNQTNLLVFAMGFHDQ